MYACFKRPSSWIGCQCFYYSWAPEILLKTTAVISYLLSLRVLNDQIFYKVFIKHHRLWGWSCGVYSLVSHITVEAGIQILESTGTALYLNSDCFSGQSYTQCVKGMCLLQLQCFSSCGSQHKVSFPVIARSCNFVFSFLIILDLHLKTVLFAHNLHCLHLAIVYFFS